MTKLGILISGRGSNMAAIIENCKTKQIPAEACIVISSSEQAAGLNYAKKHGIPTLVCNPKNYESKADCEAAICAALAEHGIDLVILAGYMKIVGPTLLDAYPSRILNIHPSLLPAFKGLDAQQQALDYGVKVSGCTVHFVDSSIDGGEIIDQAWVPVKDSDTVDSLSARILAEEHQLYSKAICELIENEE